MSHEQLHLLYFLLDRFWKMAQSQDADTWGNPEGLRKTIVEMQGYVEAELDFRLKEAKQATT